MFNLGIVIVAAAALHGGFTDTISTNTGTRDRLGDASFASSNKLFTNILYNRLLQLRDTRLGRSGTRTNMLGHQIYLDGDIVNTLTSNQTTYVYPFIVRLKLADHSRSSISDVFRNSLAIPVYFSAASVLIFAIHILHTWRPIMKICGRLLLRHKAVGQEAHSQDGTAVDTTPQPSLQVQSHILSHGGLAIFAFEVARLLGCLLLMALSLATVLVGVDATKSNLIESRGKDVLIEFTKAKSVQSASCITAVSVFILAFCH